MSSFENLRIVDNFYQTSSYIPMPTVLISSLAEDGSTSVGSYSLCFPYYIAGKGYYALILEARNSSNTLSKVPCVSEITPIFIKIDSYYCKCTEKNCTFVLIVHKIIIHRNYEEGNLYRGDGSYVHKYKLCIGTAKSVVDARGRFTRGACRW